MRIKIEVECPCCGETNVYEYEEGVDDPEVMCLNCWDLIPLPDEK